MKVTLNCITRPMPSYDNTCAGELDTTISTEEYIIYAARISVEERLNNKTAPKLLKYLIDQKHWSPFEMVSIGIEVETSRAIAQQILRHKSYSFQEFSQRYSEVTEYEPVQLRYQAEKNRQSSTDIFNDVALIAEGEALIKSCFAYYKKLIKAKVAKECARMYLPLTSKTTVILHGTLRSWIHFFEQRCDEHAQLEIQQIAFAARDEISKKFPWTAKALNWSNENA